MTGEIITVDPDLKLSSQSHISGQVSPQIVFDDVFVAPPEGLIFKNYRLSVPKQVTAQRIKYRVPFGAIYRPQRFDATPVLHLLGKNQSSFGHFFLEHIPRLLGALTSTVCPCPSEIGVLVSPTSQQMLREFIQVLGLDNCYPLVLPSRGCFYSDLIYSEPPDNPFGIFDANDRKVLSALMHERRLTKSQGSGSIFLSRATASKRKLENEMAVFSVCREFVPDIELVDLGVLDLKAQIACMQEAKLVIGPTGQAFTSSIFGHEKSVNIVLTKGSPHPFNWATRFASLATFGDSNGFVVFETNQKVPFQKGWSYDTGLLRKQLEVVFEQISKASALNHKRMHTRI